MLSKILRTISIIIISIVSKSMFGNQKETQYVILSKVAVNVINVI